MPLSPDQLKELGDAIYDVTQRNTDCESSQSWFYVERQEEDEEGYADIHIILFASEADLEPHLEDRVDEPRPSSRDATSRGEGDRPSQEGE
jgi:nitroreductase